MTRLYRSLTDAGHELRGVDRLFSGDESPGCSTGNIPKFRHRNSVQREMFPVERSAQ